jgi:hypothetical protein
MSMRVLQSVRRSVEVMPPYNISIQRQDPPLWPRLVCPLLRGCQIRKAVCSFGSTIFGRRRCGHFSGEGGGGKPSLNQTIILKAYC